MNEGVRNALIAAGIHVLDDAEAVNFNLSWRARRPLRLEISVQLRAGMYDFDRVGAFTYLGGGHSIFRGIRSIGRFCSIAGNINAGPVEHPTYQITANPVIHGSFNAVWPEARAFCERNASAIADCRRIWLDDARSRFGPIDIGNDVWIGEGAFIRRGVTIGDGAIIAARSVVTRDVRPYMIVAGSPAQPVRLRFKEVIVERMLASRWWNYGLSALEGASFRAVEDTIQSVEENISSGRARLFTPGYVELDHQGVVREFRGRPLTSRTQEITRAEWGGCKR